MPYLFGTRWAGPVAGLRVRVLVLCLVCRNGRKPVDEYITDRQRQPLYSDTAAAILKSTSLPSTTTLGDCLLTQFYLPTE